LKHLIRIVIKNIAIDVGAVEVTFGGVQNHLVQIKSQHYGFNPVELL
jgi:hypothetical protein